MASPAPSLRAPRLGFAGTGWIGRQRLKSLLDAGAAEAVALCDPAPEALEQAAEIAPAAARYDRSEPLLERHDLDGLVIATPSAQHAEQCMAALDRGLAVFCQKPLGRTGAEVRRVVEAADRADRRLGVDFCYRDVEGSRLMRELVAGGELGHVFAADLVFHAGQDCLIEASLHGTHGAVSLKNVGGSFDDFRTERCQGTSRQTLAESPEAWADAPSRIGRGRWPAARASTRPPGERCRWPK